MKQLPLRTLIPITAAAALVAIGCGGKAIDEAPSGGDGDGDGDGPGPTPSDPLSDANFTQTFDRAIENYCVLVVECGGFETQSRCIAELRSIFSLSFELESRNCRGLFVDTMNCVDEQWDGCESYSDSCYDIGEEFTEVCGTYDDYDYDY